MMVRSASKGIYSIRVVCNNTLTIALKGNVNKVAIRHTASSVHDRLDAAKATLGLISYGRQSSFRIL
jgi:hypothetical protein